MRDMGGRSVTSAVAGGDRQRVGVAQRKSTESRLPSPPRVSPKALRQSSERDNCPQEKPEPEATAGVHWQTSSGRARPHLVYGYGRAGGMMGDSQPATETTAGGVHHPAADTGHRVQSTTLVRGVLPLLPRRTGSAIRAAHGMDLRWCSYRGQLEYGLDRC